ncbi:transcriptional repressor LexA [Anaerosolibacter sp.]|uniref:transcriptional repressor LexA n=1 Tax=Anaerosolibacter sp. TaxID=1872527 RepID=UPI003A2226BD
MIHDLTNSQERILFYIREELFTKGYPPTVREICEAVGFSSTSTVHEHLKSLENKGYIRRDPTKPRAIELLDNDGNNMISKKETIEIPIIGKVAAGVPILADENIEEMFPVPLDFVSSGTHFMLKVKGNSMIDVSILNGDYVLVRQQDAANNGDIVVALVGNEATVKRFYREKNFIRLQPANPSMEPIIAIDVTILGRVKGVFRKL